MSPRSGPTPFKYSMGVCNMLPEDEIVDSFYKDKGKREK
jgi:hypothetical protein